jgi:hypothetical protein
MVSEMATNGRNDTYPDPSLPPAQGRGIVFSSERIYKDICRYSDLDQEIEG